MKPLTENYIRYRAEFELNRAINNGYTPCITTNTSRQFSLKEIQGFHFLAYHRWFDIRSLQHLFSQSKYFRRAICPQHTSCYFHPENHDMLEEPATGTPHAGFPVDKEPSS